VKTLDRASTVRLVVPETWAVGEVPAKARTRGRAASTTPHEALVTALGGEDMTLVDQFELTAPPAPRTRAGTRAARPAPALTVDVGAKEDAVLLVENEGVYAWQLPSAPTATRRAFDLTPSIFERARVYVFKFIARVGLTATVRFLERKKRNGWVHMAGTDTGGWTALDDLAQLKLPRDRPARILLWVHGTFSSTRGSFGALGTTPSGRRFLETAGRSYDAIVGWDHATLGLDPRENAIDLLAKLEGVSWPAPPVIDAIAYSRGGLVLRSLIEHLLPSSALQTRISRAVFVACTHDGTPLASPERWSDLADLYTNLAVAAFGASGTLAGEMIGSLGALVKYLATAVIDERSVPGLAAMRPGGPFVDELNRTQRGQPKAEDAHYFVVTSDFSSKAAEGLPQRLLDRLADGVILEGNDLVVNTASMDAIDRAAGMFVKDRFDFGTNPRVYHLVYFAQSEVAEALARWLTPAAERKTSAPSGAVGTAGGKGRPRIGASPGPLR
jgi:hypothetical protein